ncbi:hypothetical protein FGO68_gene11284 [Halteria grandinella]|uniref:DNA-(apurinic or apyrimidinic site) lyase n=1 Tax=Halteria grandinella TaxID=5974 RepID=A0A8J8NNF3_HALGN|nr:hypothetical protein FGO68_gene11284 [Halteria grandinella]
MWKSLVIHRKELALQNTLVNGQCFNWKKLAPDHFQGILGDFFVTLKRAADNDTHLHYMTIPDDSDGKFLTLFKRYIQYDTVKVQELYAEWSLRLKHFKEIASHIEGVRCVRQDPWECTISFICSQNNHIKRITAMLEVMRQQYGQYICDVEEPVETDASSKEEEKKEPLKAIRKIYRFPTVDELKKATEAELRGLGFGYRAKFIVQSVKMIEEKGGDKWFESLRGKPLEKVRAELVTLMGVGNKVADCIALFSLDCADSVPVDTHVFQIAQKLGYIKGLKFQASMTDKLYVEIGDAFRKRFGDKAGWAHQILFAGDLDSFKEVIAESKKRSLGEITKEENVSEIKGGAGKANPEEGPKQIQNVKRLKK